MTKQEAYLREWIRTNLRLYVTPVESMGPDPSVKVGLRFYDEEEAFTYEYINIPYNET